MSIRMDCEILERWARCSVEDLIEGNECPSEYMVDLETLVISLSTLIFDINKNVSTFGDIREQINHHFSQDIEYNGSNEILYEYIEKFLIFAVSSSCARQEDNVKTILSMETSDQAYLMQVIQRARQSSSQIDGCRVHDSDNDINVEEDDEKIPSASESAIVIDVMGACEPIQIRKKREVIPLSYIDETCGRCEEKKHVIQNLYNQVSTLTTRLEDMETKFKAEIALSMNKLVDVEVLVLEKDRAIMLLQESLGKADNRATECEEQLRNQKDYSRQIVEMQDRIDCLEPQAERAAVLEVQFDRLREKLEEQTTLKQQLKQEFASHAETYNKLLAAETELEITRKHKPQLDEYRLKQAEITILSESLKSQVSLQEQEIARLSSLLNAFSSSENNVVAQTQVLSEELRIANERIRQLERGDGVGESLTELNPAILNELQTLRARNQELMSKLDHSSLESLDRLQSDMEDLRCVNGNLQGKWAQTCDDLACARVSIQQLQLAFLQEVEKGAAVSEQFKETVAMCEDDRLAITMRHEKVKKCLIDQHTARVTELYEVSTQAANELTRELQQCRCDLLLSTEREAILLEASVRLQAQVDEISESLFAQKAKLVQAIEEHEEERSALEVRHKSLIEVEEEKARAAQADLDVERTKRRRLDREKKLLEAEAHRLKTQVQMAGSGGGPEVEAAMREFKNMQVQLDEAQVEINQLRLQLGTSSSGNLAVSASLSGVDALDEEGTGGAGRKPTRLRGPKRNYRGNAIDRGDVTLDSGLALQHNELSEKRLDQMQREKREMIARNLEENKEKIELSQKLLVSERELTTLKSRMTKLTLENERLQRRLAKSIEAAASTTSCVTNNENAINGLEISM